MSQMKISWSLDHFKCESCSKNCRRRRGSGPGKASFANEILRYFMDGESVVDTEGLRILKPGDADYQAAFKRAMAVDQLIIAADERHQATKIREVDKIINHSKKLMQIYRELTGKTVEPLMDLYEFDETSPKYLAKIPRRRGSAIRVV